MNEIKILGESISVSDGYIDICKLKFLKDNPRVYSCTYGEPDFDNKTEEEQQEIIYKKLLEEPSVKKLKPEIKRHGGLMELILIRHDSMVVIEGNSRLAVYRMLNDAGEEGEWDRIPCNIVSGLTEPQQAAFLNQIHVKGKTQWSAYEKANFAYVRKVGGSDFSTIAKLFGESEATIRVRVKSIGMMKDNEDNDQPHFSCYEVLVRYNKEIRREMEKASGCRENILLDIKNLGSDEKNNPFTAQDLRNKFPVVLKKPKVLKKYIAREINLDEAYQRAKISGVEENIKQATALLDDVSKEKVSQLEQNRFGAFKQSTRKLMRMAERINNMVKDIEDKK